MEAAEATAVVPESKDTSAAEKRAQQKTPQPVEPLPSAIDTQKL